MATDRSKIDYAKAVLRRIYSSDPATSGDLSAGRLYKIVQFKTGDNFTAAGAGANASGEFFRATGTAPDTWTNGSRVAEFRLSDLKQLAAETFAAATAEVTITSTSFEGGSAGGQVTFERSLLGLAIEELIAELDPDFIAAGPTLPGGRRWGITVRV